MATPSIMRVLLAGVGGQGTILAADLLAKTAIASGLEVKLSEIHGMSQRGGSVTTVVNMGENVHSMVISEGEADYLLAFETTEALRNIHFLKPGGKLYVNDIQISPLPVLTGNQPKNWPFKLGRQKAPMLCCLVRYRQVYLLQKIPGKNKFA